MENDISVFTVKNYERSSFFSVVYIARKTKSKFDTRVETEFFRLKLS